ncbi:exodeoxyribonuclease VII large subunit [Candidatus Allofournierella merdipullorum]|uniref:exodeoxyribonuclease VII large subunit n=1 Tax=Candidatus Allofournierella merdipullorum TaxID=2838595 RepID=UPI002A854938|nr:exodeoxyribonuclease VII large subunit [Candidatus Fournierella merdipullorum]
MTDVIGVGALNRYVKSVLDSDGFLSDLALRGEVSGFVNHVKSGHWYFTLKDEKASVKAVMFRQEARRLGFVPQDGMRVIVRCRVSLYEATGSFQVYVQDLFPDGLGAAQLAFDQLKARLEQEGLFGPEHKKPLPAYPRCIGVVTSATGAALQDIRNVLGRRWPLATLLLAGVNVQGLGAAGEISSAITTLDRSGLADVIIVARGGGSREDLWVFNDEGIARVAYACKTPLISAVGHEIDVSILDYVADLRAPTPSAAAELAVPDREAERKKICTTLSNIHEYMHSRLNLCYNELAAARNVAGQLNSEKLCRPQRDKLLELCAELRKTQSRLLTEKRRELVSACALAHSLSPYAVLGRGYAILRDEAGACVPVAALRPDQIIRLQGQGASALCRVEQVIPTQEDTNEKSQKL